jgi:hypothetical protein
MPPVRRKTNPNIPSFVNRLRRRVGMLKSNRQARVPAPCQGSRRSMGYVKALLVAAVVVTVRVAVCAAAPAIRTGLVEPKLSVGKYTAPFGLEVIAAVSVTLPVKPLAGVIVTVDVFPLVAPGATVTAVPLTVTVGVVCPADR